MIKSWWHGGTTVPATEAPPAADPVRVAVEHASHGGRGMPVGHLAMLLAELATAGSAEPGRAALAALAGSPQAVVRLDEQARSAWWYELRRASLAERVVARLADGAVEAPLAVALASTYGDGRVRERAVAAMLAAPSVELMPFLVLRTSDWARPVRDRARAGLVLLLANAPGAYLTAVLAATTAIEKRHRGTFAAAQVAVALSSASSAERRALLALPHLASRRFVCDLGLTSGWWSLEELVGLAESGPHVRTRARAAEAACRDAVWRQRVDVLHRLAGSSRPEVRVLALVGFVRTGNAADVVAYLTDPAPLARALARDAARRVGVDAFATYRDALLTAPTSSAIAGFVETADPAAFALLDPLLSHPEAKVRAAAVRGLRQLHAVDVGRMVPMLRDPSAAVVRETATALRLIVRALPTDLPWDLLSDTRTARRRAGYRLLTAGPLRVRLRAGLVATADPDPRLASRARADVTRLARDAAASTWHCDAMSDLTLTAEEQADLRAVLRRATPVLEPDAAASLTSWLDASASA